MELLKTNYESIRQGILSLIKNDSDGRRSDAEVLLTADHVDYIWVAVRLFDTD